MLRKSWTADTKRGMASGGCAMLVASAIAALAAPAAHAADWLMYINDDGGNQGTGPNDFTNTTVIYAEPSLWDANTAPVADFYVQMATLSPSRGSCKPF